MTTVEWNGMKWNCMNKKERERERERKEREREGGGGSF